MADIGEMVGISEHLFIKRVPGGIKINERGRIVTIAPVEFPGLLAALEAAAQGMGVETGKAEMVKACKALLEAFEGYEMLAALPIDVAEKARAAIAKAEGK